MRTYAPGFWQTVKWAWVQYAAVLVIFVVALGALRRFVFDNRLVLTYTTLPWPTGPRPHAH